MSETSGTAPRLRVDHFDGRSARAQPAEIWLDSGQLHLVALESRQYPVAAVRWPERQHHGKRQALLPDGGVLGAPDAAAWDDWARASGLRDSITVRWMQSWRHAGIAVVLLLLTLAAGWRWGVPLLAEGLLAVVPAGVEQELGAQALQYLDRHLLGASALTPAQQRQVGERFAQAVAAAEPALGPQPGYRLHFRKGPKSLGPNAFALPGGDIVMTDALVELMADTPDAVTGVLAHELGHVRHRHGLRMTVQAGLVGAVAGLVVGDFSALLAGAPALLAQQAYSRAFEREADEHARRLLRAARIPPRAMATFFERLAQDRADRSALPIAIASHPADEERIRFFSD